jgi:hypothetical protein
MQKTVKFLENHPKRDWDTYDFICGFEFSVTDTHLIGTAYEAERVHRLKVILSDDLMTNWGLWDTNEKGVSDAMLKVAYQSAEEYISGFIKNEVALDKELPALERTTTNSPRLCPFKIVNIAYPNKNTFVVDFDKPFESASLPSLNYQDKVTESKSRSLKVFLCHTTGDKPAVRALYKHLRVDGVDAWLDEEKLLPGQNWQDEISKAVKESDVVIICLSNNSITKEGYVQKEIKFALDVADEKPDGTIYIIPIRLEHCVVPQKLNKLQWADLYFDGKSFDTHEYSKLLSSLQIRANSIGISLPVINDETLLNRFIDLGNRLRVLLLSRASRHGMSNARTTDFPNVLIFLRDTGLLEAEEYYEVDQLDKLYHEILHGKADYRQELTPGMVNRLDAIVGLYEDLESNV